MATVFSYGSNSTRQLRLRLENSKLVSEPAYLEGYARVFCLQSPAWDGGGVASLARASESHRVLGSVIWVTHDELARLDQFETGYRKEHFTVVVGKKRVPNVIAYIALPGGNAGSSDAAVCGSSLKRCDEWTPAMTVEPSEMYLSAVRLHLIEHWPADECNSIDIFSFHQGSCHLIRVWKYPGLDLLGVEGVLVQVNGHKEHPWVDGGPARRKNIVTIANILRGDGICNGRDLRAAVREERRVENILERNNFASFIADTMMAIKKTLK